MVRMRRLRDAVESSQGKTLLIGGNIKHWEYESIRKVPYGHYQHNEPWFLTVYAIPGWWVKRFHYSSDSKYYAFFTCQSAFPKIANALLSQSPTPNPEFQSLANITHDSTQSRSFNSSARWADSEGHSPSRHPQQPFHLSIHTDHHACIWNRTYNNSAAKRIVTIGAETELVGNLPARHGIDTYVNQSKWLAIAREKEGNFRERWRHTNGYGRIGLTSCANESSTVAALDDEGYVAEVLDLCVSTCWGWVTGAIDIAWGRYSED